MMFKLIGTCSLFIFISTSMSCALKKKSLDKTTHENTLPSDFTADEDVKVANHFLNLAIETKQAFETFKNETDDYTPENETETALLSLANDIETVSENEIGTIYESPISFNNSITLTQNNTDKSTIGYGTVLGGALVATSLITAIVVQQKTKGAYKQGRGPDILYDKYIHDVKKSMLLKGNDYSVTKIFAPDGKGNLVQIAEEFKPKKTSLPTLYTFGDFPQFYEANSKTAKDYLADIKVEDRVLINYESTKVKKYYSFDNRVGKSQPSSAIYELTLKPQKTVHLYRKENVGIVLAEGPAKESEIFKKAQKLDKGVEVAGYREGSKDFVEMRKAMFDDLKINPTVENFRIEVAKYRAPIFVALGIGVLGGIGAIVADQTSKKNLGLNENSQSPFKTLTDKLIKIEEKLISYHKETLEKN